MNNYEKYISEMESHGFTKKQIDRRLTIMRDVEDVPLKILEVNYTHGLQLDRHCDFCKETAEWEIKGILLVDKSNFITTVCQSHKVAIMLNKFPHR